MFEARAILATKWNNCANDWELVARKGVENLPNISHSKQLAWRRRLRYAKQCRIRAIRWLQGKIQP